LNSTNKQKLNYSNNILEGSIKLQIFLKRGCQTKLAGINWRKLEYYWTFKL